MRSATADCHRRVDEIFSAADLSEASSYGDFLRAQAAAFLPAEDALAAAGAADLFADWPSRRRGALLIADIEALGIETPDPVGRPSIVTPVQALGALYVLEGSRLGGALLKRSVPSNLQSDFLGGMCSKSWQSLLATMEDMLDTSDKLAAATDAARRIFGLFEAAGRLYVRPRVPAA
jgi:heme oxygenase